MLNPEPSLSQRSTANGTSPRGRIEVLVGEEIDTQMLSARISQAAAVFEHQIPVRYLKALDLEAAVGAEYTRIGIT